MGVTFVEVTLPEVARTRSARADVRFHELSRRVRPVFDALAEPNSLGSLSISVANGSNLPATLYADEEDEAGAIYVSVAGLSQFVLQSDACVPLKNDQGQDFSEASAVVVGANEVLMTRSGTPGIAWSSSESPGELPLVASGFLIRVVVDESKVSPGYVAAILNHPVWRIASLAESAGKRQDNIGQDSIRDIPVPMPGLEVREKIAALHVQTLETIEEFLSDKAGIASQCNAVLMDVAGLAPPAQSETRIRTSHVALTDVAATRTTRMDNRFHGPDFRDVRSTLATLACSSLGTCLTSTPAKGRQPTWVDDADLPEDHPRAIATASLQDGQVSFALTKPTTAASVEAFPVAQGDLLVAMDGDGSIGKAAVVGPTEAPLTVDSHVAVLKVDDPDIANALACYLNSDWGLIQTTGLMTGSTGQTQLSVTDLQQLAVPTAILENAPAVAKAFRDILASYEPRSTRVRRHIVACATQISRLLIEAGALSPDDDDLAEHLQSAEWLAHLLAVAYPRVR